MEDETKQKSVVKTLKEAGKEGIGGMVGAAVGLGATPLIVMAIGHGAVGVLATIVAGGAIGASTVLGKRGFEALSARPDKKLKTSVQSIAQDTKRTEEEVVEILVTMLEDETTSDAVSRIIQAVIETPDDAVIPALGRLLMMYQNPPRSTDSFFRSTTRMLSDCDVQDLEDLQATIHTIRDEGGGFPISSLITANIPGSANPAYETGKTAVHALSVSDGALSRPVMVTSTGRNGRLESIAVGMKAKGESMVTGMTYARAIQVVQRLGVVGIGSPRGLWGAEGVAVPREVMERLAVILTPQPENNSPPIANPTT